MEKGSAGRPRCPPPRAAGGGIGGGGAGGEDGDVVVDDGRNGWKSGGGEGLVVGMAIGGEVTVTRGDVDSGGGGGGGGGDGVGRGEEEGSDFTRVDVDGGVAAGLFISTSTISNLISCSSFPSSSLAGEIGRPALLSSPLFSMAAFVSESTESNIISSHVTNVLSRYASIVRSNSPRKRQISSACWADDDGRTAAQNRTEQRESSTYECVRKSRFCRHH